MNFMFKIQPRLLLTFPVFALLIIFILDASGQNRQTDTRRLPPNQPIERPIDSTEKHHYIFSLKASEFFQVQVEQNGINIELVLMTASGDMLMLRRGKN